MAALQHDPNFWSGGQVPDWECHPLCCGRADGSVVITCDYHAVFGIVMPECDKCTGSYVIPKWQRELERLWYWLSPFTFRLYANREPRRWFSVGVGTGIECPWNIGHTRC